MSGSGAVTDVLTKMKCLWGSKEQPCSPRCAGHCRLSSWKEAVRTK